MAQARALVDATKRALKQHGLTYAEVAAVLELSEASVKRLFAQADFTLERLERIAGMMHLELSDLMRLAERPAPALSELSAAVEAELVSDPVLLLVTVCALNHWRFEDILATYALDSHRLVRLLARLDRLQLVELLPGNRLRPRVARDFHWRPDGPIERFFRGRVQQDFLAGGFQGPGERFSFQTGMLSWASNARFQERLLRVIQEFAEAHRQDAELPLSDRHGTCLLIALRPWELPAFSALRRPDPETTTGGDAGG